MNRSEQLKDASLCLFLARYCGNKTEDARKRAIDLARHELARTVRSWRTIGNAKSQRDAINRRQRRAQRDGVELWRKGAICGMEFAQRKW